MTAKMTIAELEAFLHAEFPQAFRTGGDISIESADGKSCRIRQRFNERMLRPGGTVSGPTLMALADFAMYVVLLSAIGPVGLAVTTN
ncbi:PaaI family thioesterase, partial [Bradyrhizobium oligotrophicum]